MLESRRRRTAPRGMDAFLRDLTIDSCRQVHHEEPAGLTPGLRDALALRGRYLGTKEVFTYLLRYLGTLGTGRFIPV